MKEPPATQERRQHSMVDFSATRRLKAQELNYASNQDCSNSSLAGDYRPFSTLITGGDDGEVARPNFYGTKN